MLRNKSEIPGGCRHFWTIDPPTKGNSRGVCKLCGEVREFTNYIEYGPSRSQLAKRALEKKTQTSS